MRTHTDELAARNCQVETSQEFRRQLDELRQLAPRQSSVKTQELVEEFSASVNGLFVDTGFGAAVATHSVREAGRYQVTYFLSDGTPRGHSVESSASAAVEALIRVAAPEANGHCERLFKLGVMTRSVMPVQGRTLPLRADAFPEYLRCSRPWESPMTRDERWRQALEERVKDNPVIDLRELESAGLLQSGACLLAAHRLVSGIAATDDGKIPLAAVGTAKFPAVADFILAGGDYRLFTPEFLQKLDHQWIDVLTDCYLQGGDPAVLIQMIDDAFQAEDYYFTIEGGGNGVIPERITRHPSFLLEEHMQSLRPRQLLEAMDSRMMREEGGGKYNLLDSLEACALHHGRDLKFLSALRGSQELQPEAAEMLRFALRCGADPMPLARHYPASFLTHSLGSHDLEKHYALLRIACRSRLDLSSQWHDIIQLRHHDNAFNQLYPFIQAGVNPGEYLRALSYTEMKNLQLSGLPAYPDPRMKDIGVHAYGSLAHWVLKGQDPGLILDAGLSDDQICAVLRHAERDFDITPMLDRRCSVEMMSAICAVQRSGHDPHPLLVLDYTLAEEAHHGTLKLMKDCLIHGLDARLPLCLVKSASAEHDPYLISSMLDAVKRGLDPKPLLAFNGRMDRSQLQLVMEVMQQGEDPERLLQLIGKTIWNKSYASHRVTEVDLEAAALLLSEQHGPRSQSPSGLSL